MMLWQTAHSHSSYCGTRSNDANLIDTLDNNEDISGVSVFRTISLLILASSDNFFTTGIEPTDTDSVLNSLALSSQDLFTSSSQVP